MFVQDGISAACLFFPKLGGVDMYRFCIEDNFDLGLTKDSFSAKTGIPEEKTPRLILLFWKFSFGNTAYFTPRKFVSKTLAVCGDVAIAGSDVKSFFTDRAFNPQNQNQ